MGTCWPGFRMSEQPGEWRPRDRDCVHGHAERIYLPSRRLGIPAMVLATVTIQLSEPLVHVPEFVQCTPSGVSLKNPGKGAGASPRQKPGYRGIGTDFSTLGM